MKYFILMLMGTIALSSEATDIIKKYGHSIKCGNSCHEGILKIIVDSKSDGHYKCTGFLVDNLILTNKHCVPKEITTMNPSCKGKVFFNFLKLKPKKQESYNVIN